MGVPPQHLKNIAVNTLGLYQVANGQYPSSFSPRYSRPLILLVFSMVYIKQGLRGCSTLKALEIGHCQTCCKADKSVAPATPFAALHLDTDTHLCITRRLNNLKPTPKTTSISACKQASFPCRFRACTCKRSHRLRGVVRASPDALAIGVPAAPLVAPCIAVTLRDFMVANMFRVVLSLCWGISHTSVARIQRFFSAARTSTTDFWPSFQFVRCGKMQLPFRTNCPDPEISVVDVLASLLSA